MLSFWVIFLQNVHSCRPWEYHIISLLSVLLLQVDDEAVELNKELVSNLLELDDVDAVYTDQK
jgi:hypothetical protein